MAWSADGRWIAVNSGYSETTVVYIVPVSRRRTTEGPYSSTRSGTFLFSPESVTGWGEPGVLCPGTRFECTEYKPGCAS